MVKYDATHKTYYCKFSYKDWTGKTRWTTKRGFTRRKDAVAYEIDAKRSAAATQDLTVEQLGRRWLDDCKQRGLAAGTMREYNSIFKLHIIPSLGALVAAEVTANTIREWHNHLTHASSTRAIIRTVLMMIFRFGQRYFGLTRNPLEGLILPRKKVTTARSHIEQIWEPEDFVKFLSVIPRCFTERRLAYTILFYSGMRCGEMMALGADDFDFGANKISITKTCSGNFRAIGVPKTPSGHRTIVMPADIMQAVRDFIGSFQTPPERIFGDTFSRQSIVYWLRKYAEQAGVPRIRVHDIRHSHASLLIHQGVPITDISRRLGHKSSAITLQVYSHFYPHGDVEIAEKLSNLEKIGSLLGQDKK